MLVSFGKYLYELFCGFHFQLYPYARPPTTVYENYGSEHSRGLGVLMIVAGILCIIFNIVSLVLGRLLSVVGYGIWGGIWVGLRPEDQSSDQS